MKSTLFGILLAGLIGTTPIQYKTDYPGNKKVTIEYNAESFGGIDIAKATWTIDSYTDSKQYEIFDSLLSFKPKGLLSRLLGNPQSFQSSNQYDDSRMGMKLLEYRMTEGKKDVIEYRQEEYGIESYCMKNRKKIECPYTNMKYPEFYATLFNLAFIPYPDNNLTAIVFHKGRTGDITISPKGHEKVKLESGTIDTQVYLITGLEDIIDPEDIKNRDTLSFRASMSVNYPHYPEKIEVKGLKLPFVIKRVIIK